MMDRDGWAGNRVSNPTAFAWFVWEHDYTGNATKLIASRGSEARHDRSPPGRRNELASAYPSSRRELKKLSASVDRVTEADRLFFERFPHRQHRVRLTSLAEIARQELIDGRPMTIPPGFRWFTAVHNIAPGFRLYLFVPNLEGAETDLDEATAREIFRGVTPYLGNRGATARGCRGSAMMHAQPERPVPFQGDLRNLPEALSPLKQLPNWVCWRYELRTGKWTKPPLQPGNPKRYAKNNDPSTWGTYEQALAAFEAGQCDGIGFNLLGTDIAAFDIDDCRDPATGDIAPEAMAIVDRATLLHGDDAIGHRPARRRLRLRRQDAPEAKDPRQPCGGRKLPRCRALHRRHRQSAAGHPRQWPHMVDIGDVIDAVVAELDGCKDEARQESRPGQGPAGSDDEFEDKPSRCRIGKWRYRDRQAPIRVTPSCRVI